MPEQYDDTRGPGKSPGWRKISSFSLPDRQKINVWLTIYPSPLSMGMGDAFEVPEAWRENGKWFHVHKGRSMEIRGNYVTHWRPVRDTNGSSPETVSDNPGEQI